ncbi:hypothetical protein [Francisella sp. LA112445]|uniref:hypothetical protein n=1 Tax=Francisella sp. LA112445 TaxID=1395624 RepID=UPI001788D560|nr:hypothetical protein [Francisella sp. LA112445]QIW09662.1 hypothetical protein FIP56_02810 [Francisella sp. LA112445]
MSDFTFDYYKKIFQTALDSDYQVITLKEFFSEEYDKNKKIVVNRIDVDVKIDRLKTIYKIFKELNLKASVYVRLHAPNYNLLSIGNIKIMQELISIGCEIGLHTELEDIGGYCNINKVKLLKQEIKLFETLFDIKVYGTASHGDMTHYNNLDFWKTHSYSDFGLLYEAYDKQLWNNCRYVSDSEWTRWKAYENGRLLGNDRRTPSEHIIEDKPKVLHILTHPESWYEGYIYE